MLCVHKAWKSTKQVETSKLVMSVFPEAITLFVLISRTALWQICILPCRITRLQIPRPYDDTGWTMQYLRNLKLVSVTDKTILNAPMTLLTADAKASGGVDGAGSTLVIEHTTDNVLMSFRFKNRNVKMLAAEEDFDLNGRKFKAGAFIIPNADRGTLEPQLKDLGITAVAVSAAPTVKTHDLDVPRIGYIHSWSRTQDEGWTRAALDYYSVPFTYFADQKLREGNLRAKFDVLFIRTSVALPSLKWQAYP